MHHALYASFGLLLTAGCTAHFAQNGAATAPATWTSRPQRLRELEQAQTTWLYQESQVPAYTLPDPLLTHAGQRVTTARQWEDQLRPATLELFRKLVFGRTPQAPPSLSYELLEEDSHALGGQALRRTLRIHVPLPSGGTYPIEASLFLPAHRIGPFPTFLLINNRPVEAADPSRRRQTGFWPVEEIVARGYATAVFRTTQVQPDTANGLTQGLIAAFDSDTPRAPDAWATISAWSFAASRVMDYLQTLPEVDHTRVAIVGHSRGGKTSLWTGAQDPRFALVISNDSGCCGAAIGRRKFGETFAAINRQFPHWFCDNFKAFTEDTLPLDQHQLISLVAPRAIYVASADDDLWADPRGEFLGLAGASPVYALYGNPLISPAEMPPLNQPLVRGRMAYHIRPGIHNLTLADWSNYMDFADRLWKRK